MKFCHLQINRWKWRTSSEVKLAKFRKSKTTCSFSYVEYKPNKNTNNIMKNRLGKREATFKRGSVKEVN
jgi:hypothetical protein